MYKKHFDIVFSIKVVIDTYREFNEYQKKKHQFYECIGSNNRFEIVHYYTKVNSYILFRYKHNSFSSRKIMLFVFKISTVDKITLDVFLSIKKCLTYENLKYSDIIGSSIGNFFGIKFGSKGRYN